MVILDLGFIDALSIFPKQIALQIKAGHVIFANSLVIPLGYMFTTVFVTYIVVLRWWFQLLFGNFDTKNTR